MFSKIIICFFLITSAIPLQSQSFYIPNDTAGLRHICDSVKKIFSNTTGSEQDLLLAQEILSISEKMNFTDGIINGNLFIGYIYEARGEYTKTLEKNFAIITLCEKTNSKKFLAVGYSNIGRIYILKGDYSSSLDYLMKSLKIYEALKDTSGIDANLNNIASVYFYQKMYLQALEYYKRAAKLCIERHDTLNYGKKMNNIGGSYFMMKDYDKALTYFTTAFQIAENTNATIQMLSALNNMASLYEEKGDIDKAIEKSEKAYSISKEIKNKEKEALAINNLASFYFKKNNFSKALQYSENLFILANELSSKSHRANALSRFCEIYSKLGNYKKAFEYLSQYTVLNDSMFNENNTKQITEMQTKYETEKKEKEIEIQNLQIGQQTLELNKKQIIIYAVLGGLILVLSLVVIVFRSYRQKKKDNKVITLKNTELEQANEEISAQRDEIEAQRDRLGEQNEILAEQKKEITDSINYAKHIQQAILPDLENLGFSDLDFGNFTESNQFATSNLKPQTSNLFILFKPKDIVSGDFYWATIVNNWLIVTVADCTGHGVPGAFMSMLGVSFLNEIVRKKEITKASEVLDNLRASIIDALQQKGQLDEQKDGMDMSLIAIKLQVPSSKLQATSEEEVEKVRQGEREKVSEGESENEADNNQLAIDNNQSYHAQWAGANNPLWIVRCSKNLQGFENLGGLEELKPDKQPVAICESIKPFTNHELQLYKGDILYFASDGFEDQFGGAKYKKFMSRQLKETLVSISSQPMSEQKQILENTFISWKGENEQIDDVTILGLKI